MAVEFVARHNITSGGKGKRKTILAGQRFNPADYPDIGREEWEAMAKNGTILPPNEPNYASQAAMVPVEEEEKPAAVRSRSARKPVEDDDDDDEV